MCVTVCVHNINKNGLISVFLHNSHRIKRKYVKCRFIPLSRLDGLFIEKDPLESTLNIFRLSKTECSKH